MEITESLRKSMLAAGVSPAYAKETAKMADQGKLGQRLLALCKEGKFRKAVSDGESFLLIGTSPQVTACAHMLVRGALHSGATAKIFHPADLLDDDTAKQFNRIILPALLGFYEPSCGNRPFSDAEAYAIGNVVKERLTEGKSILFQADEMPAKWWSSSVLEVVKSSTANWILK